jgi:uncharacterized phiE125 gp8 family phage protein
MLKIKTQPAIEPVTLPEAFKHLGIPEANYQDDGDTISAMIKAAREQVEAITRRALITQTWYLYLDAFPTVISMPLSPLQSVTSIKYVDSAGTLQTLTASAYHVDTTSEPARIEPAYGEVWPTIRGDLGGITIEFVCGYGATAATVPQSIKNAILLELERLYERDPRTMDGLEKARDALLASYRVVMF